MSILEFVSQDTLDDLDEDPRIAFMELVNAAQRTLSSKLDNLNPSDNEDWQKIEEFRYSFMNVVVASAKRFEIEPFVSMSVPTFLTFKEVDHRQFKSDLDHYLTQLILDNSLRSKKDSVSILPNYKDRIRTYVSGLRQCVENANMTGAKREALLKRLDDFEAELEKRRLNMITAAKFAYYVLGIPGTLWASEEVVHKLATNIMHVVAEAKVEEDKAKQLPGTAPLKALTAPRTTEAPKRSAFDSDLDDDVPF